MLRALFFRGLMANAMSGIFAAIVHAETLDTARFSELLTLARGYVGAATFVDAEMLVLEKGHAVDFLFRSDSGVLMSVALDLETASILSRSDRSTILSRGDLSEAIPEGQDGAPTIPDEPQIDDERQDGKEDDRDSGRNGPGRDSGRGRGDDGDSGGRSGGGPGNP